MTTPKTARIVNQLNITIDVENAINVPSIPLGIIFAIIIQLGIIVNDLSIVSANYPETIYSNISGIPYSTFLRVTKKYFNEFAIT